jgi:hypothetical protein
LQFAARLRDRLAFFACQNLRELFLVVFEQARGLRVGDGVVRQPRKAFAADSTAARASSRVACRTVPRTSSVFAGFMFDAMRVEDDSTHLPLIKLR